MTILGSDTNSGALVSINDNARSRGIYVIGSTGTGKTTLLQSIAYQDMNAGHGLCVLDPHGDMIEWLLQRVPENRVKDTILFDPGDYDYPFGLNLLACDQTNPEQTRRVVSTLLGTLRRMFSYSWGPRLEHVLRHGLQTTMEIPGSTIIELLLLLTDKKFRVEKTKKLQDPFLVTFWENFPTNDKDLNELISSTVNKLTPFLLDQTMRNIVGQTESTIELSHIMEESKILLVNLAKGKLGEVNSSLLGSVLINFILTAALQRYDVTQKDRENAPFHLIVDEYQNFASESFSILQSEARKYAVDLIVAHQFRDQLDDEAKGSALNVGNFVTFRVTGVDSIDLARQFDNTPPPADPIWEPIRQPSESWPGYHERGIVDELKPGTRRLYSDVMMQAANELANLIPFRAKAKIIQQNQKVKRPFLSEYLIDTFDPNNKKYRNAYYGTPSKSIAEKIRQRSRSKARPRVRVEAEIIKRIGKDTTKQESYHPTAQLREKR